MGVPRLQLDEAAEAVVDAYRNYELSERRLGELTVSNACYLVRKFLAWRAATGRPQLELLGAGELHDYVRSEAGRLRIGAVPADGRGVAHVHAVLVRDRCHRRGSDWLCAVGVGDPFRRAPESAG